MRLSNLYRWIFQLLNLLIQNVESKNDIVRKYCYRGVGNISYLSSLRSNSKVMENNMAREDLFTINDSTSSLIIKMILRGVEDSSSRCIQESLDSFQRIVESLNETQLYSNLGEISHKLRICFERYF